MSKIGSARGNALRDRGTDKVCTKSGSAPIPSKPTVPQSRPGIGLISRVGIDQSAQPDLPLAIEDYALIGDCTTAALVGHNGSIDWLCWPRFDSNACFAALLGTSNNGRWRIGPADPAPRVERTYRDGMMVLETVFETEDGGVALIDFMPIGGANSSVVRLVEGRRGKVAMRLHLSHLALYRDLATPRGGGNIELSRGRAHLIGTGFSRTNMDREVKRAIPRPLQPVGKRCAVAR
jgi:hypothetical protein